MAREQFSKGLEITIVQKSRIGLDGIENVVAFGGCETALALVGVRLGRPDPESWTQAKRMHTTMFMEE